MPPIGKHTSILGIADTVGCGPHRGCGPDSDNQDAPNPTEKLFRDWIVKAKT